MNTASTPTKDLEPKAGRAVPLVSILLVNFNGAKFLAACLDSLNKVTYASREVVMVDNASSDNSLAILERYPWVKLIRSDKNLGFAGGNNLGLKQCSGVFVLLLNNDTVVAPGFLEPLVEHLTKRKGYRSIRWLSINNEPGWDWSWWQGPDGQPAPITPAFAAVRKELDRRGITVPLSGPDWTDLPELEPAKIDFDSYIGAWLDEPSPRPQFARSCAPCKNYHS